MGKQAITTHADAQQYRATAHTLLHKVCVLLHFLYMCECVRFVSVPNLGAIRNA